MEIIIAEMERLGDNSANYLIGVYSDQHLAEKHTEIEKLWRGGMVCQPKFTKVNLNEFKPRNLINKQNLYNEDLNMEDRYYQLHEKMQNETATEVELQEFISICNTLLDQILEKNKELLVRLK